MGNLPSSPDKTMLKELSCGGSLFYTRGIHKGWTRDQDETGVHTILGSFVRHKLTKSLKAIENSPSRIGGFALGIRNNTLIGWYSARGGSPLASSIAVMPRDQISAFAS